MNIKNICKKLDNFIEENLEIPSNGFSAFPRDDKLEKYIDEEWEKKSISGSGSGSGSGGSDDTFFGQYIEEKREELGLKPSDLYKPALLSRDFYSKLISIDHPRPGRYPVMSLAFPLINADVIKNSPPLMSPNERMKEMLLFSGGIDYILRNTSIFDLVIIFCLNEALYDVNVVNHLLKNKDLPLLPKGLK